jgi:hypothetical protein
MKTGTTQRRVQGFGQILKFRHRDHLISGTIRLNPTKSDQIPPKKIKIRSQDTYFPYLIRRSSAFTSSLKPGKTKKLPNEPICHFQFCLQTKAIVTFVLQNTTKTNPNFPLVPASAPLRLCVNSDILPAAHPIFSRSILAPRAAQRQDYQLNVNSVRYQ